MTFPIDKAQLTKVRSIALMPGERTPEEALLILEALPQIFAKIDTLEAMYAEIFRILGETGDDLAKSYQWSNGLTEKNKKLQNQLLAAHKLFEKRFEELDSQGWIPAETAPTDGTKFDAWCVMPPDGGDLGVRFTNVHMRFDNTGFGYTHHTEKGATWEYLEQQGPLFPAWKFVFWRPIPAPPASLLAAYEERRRG